MPSDRQVSHKKKYFSAKRKLEIIDLRVKHNMTYYQVAKQCGLQAQQVKRWEKKRNVLLKIARSGKTGFVARLKNKMLPSHRAVETEVYEYVQRLRSQDVAVSSANIQQKAKEIDSTFHDGDPIKLKWWSYQFLRRHNLSVRRPTREGQKLSGHLQEEKEDFVQSITERVAEGGTLEGLDKRFIINMDETPVYFEPHGRTTIHSRGDRTVSVRTSGGSVRCTAVLAVAADGTKLPPMVIFKAVPGATIEKGLHEILPSGVVGSCEKKGFMNTRSMGIWTERVLKPHVEGSPASLVLLDD